MPRFLISDLQTTIEEKNQENAAAMTSNGDHLIMSISVPHIPEDMQIAKEENQESGAAMSSSGDSLILSIKEPHIPEEMDIIEGITTNTKSYC